MATNSKSDCFICQTDASSIVCVVCDGPFCKKCDKMFHAHPDRQIHTRKAIVSSKFGQCNCCGTENVAYFCMTCIEQKLFCGPCDELFHSHLDRQEHVRKQLHQSSSLTLDDGIHCSHCHVISTVECKDCIKSFCSECNYKFHDFPNLEDHTRSDLERICTSCDEVCATMRCDECDGWYCNLCDQAHHRLRKANHQTKLIVQGMDVKETIRIFEEQLQQHKSEKDTIVRSFEEQLQQHKSGFEEQLQQHKSEKDTIVCRFEEQLQQHKSEKEVLKEEIRDLQNQIITLKEELAVKWHYQYKEGIWKATNGPFLKDSVRYESQYYYYDVSRTEIDGDVVPGVTLDEQKTCSLYHNGKNYNNSPCEVLTSSASFKWIPCTQDYIPHQAVPGGKLKDGEVLFIGRVRDVFNGDYRNGKIQPSLKGCYTIAANGYHTIYPDYEILVWK